MKKLLALTMLLMLLLLLTVIPGSQGQEATKAELRAANDAWNDGKYATALRAYIKLLNGPSGEQYLEAIALQTGELYQTTEFTTDGRAPSLSRDGRLIAYETGPTRSPMTRIVQVGGEHAAAAEMRGTGAVFSPSGKKVAYLKSNPNDEIAKARAALESAQGQQARAAAQQSLTRLEMKYSSLIVRDLESKQEAELKTGDLLKASLAFGADGETIYFVGARESETARNDIYAVTPSSAQPVAITADAEGFKNSPVVDSSGKTMLIALPNRSPIPAPRSAAGNQPDDPTQPAGGQGQRQGGGGGGRGGGGGNAPTKFGIVDLATHKVNVVNGTAPALSDDGATIAYVTRAGQESSLMLLPVGGTATTVLKGNDRLDAPTFSPDGQRLAYQKMTRDDWEIYVVGKDGKDETRITREIQHDVLPHFLTNNRLLEVVGEPRHRRAYIYDLSTNTHFQLFRNNTVRTISPEYVWEESADGTKIMILADRDGDTVSVERGVYLVDLNRKVTKSEVLARLQKNLASEVALQSEGQKMYAPIADDVRRVLEQASTNRIYEYEKTLFDFDSKHITRPGNARAAEYLYNTYKSFGYQPEYQWFENRTAVEGKTCNVVVKLTGTENPELIYVVGSHYDSVAVGPGADDDTTGTAALLEAARVLAGHPMPATIILASFTGEEAGLLGSREFVRRAQADKLNIVGALNNDMIGWANDHRLDNTIRYSNDGIRDIQHSAAMLFTKLITYDARYHKSTDATAFFEAYGDVVGGIGSYPVLGNPHYHQATDMLEGINYQLITETSKTTVATLMLLASSPSRLKDLKVASYDGKTAELTWTPSPEKSVRSYIVSYGPNDGPKQQTKVTTPRVTLQNVKPGTVVAVKAINTRGMEGWDWVRVTVGQSANTNSK